MAVKITLAAYIKGVLHLNPGANSETLAKIAGEEWKPVITHLLRMMKHKEAEIDEHGNWWPVRKGRRITEPDSGPNTEGGDKVLAAIDSGNIEVTER